ncbi:MAG: BMP family ABC transporter substrate-binding protein [Treponema sp.]|nr:BMP family ABC transporter substrate-binding protein [Treponema sp.]
MRKVLVLAGSFFFLVFAGLFFINFYESSSESKDNNVKIGIILNGTVKDHSYSQSHYEGLKAAVKNLKNVSITYKENIESGANFLSCVENLVKSGCRIIIANSYNYAYDIELASSKYPYVYFFHASGLGNRANLTTFFGRMYQVRYLTGIVAGMQSDSGRIGYVAAFPIDEVIRGINAFTMGVRLVNPEAQVFVEWSGSWIEAGNNRRATQKLISEKEIDVLAIHTDSLVPLEEASEKDIWTIGYNYDNESMFTSTYLTGAVWNWTEFYKVKIPECIGGKLRGGHFWNGIEKRIVTLSPLTDNVKNKDEVQKILDREQKKMDVNNYDIFFGPIYDNAGNLRVPEGCCLTDESLLDDFNWYVQGVAVNAF